jgi:ABC-type uncharacterized transport system involved in gliding motility auxiliary subunit
MIKKKLWKFLVWPGIILVVAGLTSGFISQVWGTVPLALIIVGSIIIGLWLILQIQDKNFLGQRSTQTSTNALIATVAFLAILGFINFLGTRYHLRLDLTETHLFTLAPQSRELVRSLPQPVKVWLFDANQNLQDKELLENYRRQGAFFSFEYVNPQAQPRLVDKFGVKENGEVYLESGNKRQLVQVLNENERLSEARLTNRLQQINSSTTIKVYFLQGHGEHQLTAGKESISEAVQSLGDKAYTTEALNLAEKSSVPQDAAVVVAAGPKRDFFDSEIVALRDYLNRGGSLMLMLDPTTDPKDVKVDNNSKLQSLLTEWGVKLDNRLVVDTTSNVELGPAVPMVTEYGKHPITKDFGNGISFYSFARPVDTTTVPGIEATPLLLTKAYPKSWAESDLKNEKLQFNEGSDRKGPLTLGVALKRGVGAQLNPTPQPTPIPTASPITQAKTTPTSSPSPTPTAIPSPTTQAKTTSTSSPSPTPTPNNSSRQTQKESRLVVFGNSEFSTNIAFQQQLNGDVFLNSVTWLSQQDAQPLSIRPKEIKNRRINLTPSQATLLELSSRWILPLIGFAGGALIWWRRR